MHLLINLLVLAFLIWQALLVTRMQRMLIARGAIIMFALHDGLMYNDARYQVLQEIARTHGRGEEYAVASRLTKWKVR